MDKFTVDQTFNRTHRGQPQERRAAGHNRSETLSLGKLCHSPRAGCSKLAIITAASSRTSESRGFLTVRMFLDGLEWFAFAGGILRLGLLMKASRFDRLDLL